METKNCKINIDDVLVYIVETEDEFDEDALGEAERDELTTVNDKFWEKEIEPKLIATIMPCACSTVEFMLKHERRRQFSLDPNKYVPEMDQEDIDAYQFSVIIKSTNGKWVELSNFMSNCRKCKKLSVWGDLEIFAQTMAEITNEYETNSKAAELEKEADETVDTFVDKDDSDELIETIDEDENQTSTPGLIY